MMRHPNQNPQGLKGMSGGFASNFDTVQVGIPRQHLFSQSMGKFAL